MRLAHQRLEAIINRNSHRRYGTVRPAGAPRHGKLDMDGSAIHPTIYEMALAVENRFQRKVRIEMIGGQPVAIEER
jgi:hypothetical protein